MSRNASGCRGCLLWMAGLFLGLALVVGVAAWLGYRKARAFLDQFTQPAPVALPAVAWTPAEATNLHQRIDGFLTAAREGRTNAALTLTERDLNVLLHSAGFSNRVHLTLRSNAVTGQFSVPLEELGLLPFRGRYLNGTGTLAVGCANGGLRVTIQELGVNGVSLPDHYLGYIQRRNFAQGVGTNDATRAALERVGRVTVEPGRLVLETEGR